MSHRAKRLPAALLERAVAIAAATSQHNAERATGISRTTIRHQMRLRGLPRRRPGNYTAAEIDTLPQLTAAPQAKAA